MAAGAVLADGLALGLARAPNQVGSTLGARFVVAACALPGALASLSATEAANWASRDGAPFTAPGVVVLLPTEMVRPAAGLPVLARPASCRSMPAPLRAVLASDLALVAPNRAWTAVSPNPWARAKSARVAMSGRGASVVMTLSLLPSGTTCKPAAAGAALARACRSSLSIWPLKTPANSLLWGLESVPAPGLGSSPPLGAAVGAVKKFIVGSMKSSS